MFQALQIHPYMLFNSPNNLSKLKLGTPFYGRRHHSSGEVPLEPVAMASIQIHCATWSLTPKGRFQSGLVPYSSQQ